jgi:hypothetical protein
MTSLMVADTGAPVDIRVDQFATTVVGQRHIQWLLHPADWSGITRVELNAPVYTAPNDARQLGIRLLSASLTPAQHGWMPLGLWLSASWLIVMVTVAGVLLRPWLGWLGLAIGLATVVVIPLLDPVQASDWLMGTALAWSCAPLIVWGLRKHVPSALLSVTLGMYLFRLWGIMYAPFMGHDYLIHLRRVIQFANGGMWTIEAHPYEFGRRTSIIFPLYYRLADLLSTVFGHHFAMHALIITSETMLGIAVWLLVRRASGSATVAVWAGILTMMLPISSAVLWWSFMQQITAHVFTIIVAYATVRQDRRGAYIAAFCLGGIALTHIGEMMVASIWYVLLRLSEPDRWQQSWWQRTLPMLMLVPLLLPLYWPFLQTIGQNQGSLVDPNIVGTWPRMVVSFTVGFAPFPLFAVLLLLAVALVRLGRVAWSWLGVGVVFFAVELLTKAQVRYVYTLAPLLTIGLAYVLAPWWRRGMAGRVLVVAVTALLLWVSVGLWVDGVLGWRKPRIDGLTH